MKKALLLELMKKYDIDYLESLFVYVFLKRNAINKFNNQLINNKIKKVKIEDAEFIDSYLRSINGELNLKTLERIFELVIEERERKLNGAFYTPSFIVDYICSLSVKEDMTVCDCSCGSGAFLVGAAERIHSLTKKSYIEIIENNLYGVDISRRSIERTKIILSLLCLVNKQDKKEIKFNLKTGNSLELDWESSFPKIFKSNEKSKGFNAVIGNPPYVRIQNLNDLAKDKIRSKWNSAKKYNVDLYIPFIELSLNILNKDGKICLITSNSFLTTEAGKYIRNLIFEGHHLERLLDFNFLQIFEDVITYTCILSLNKKINNSFLYHKLKKEEINSLKSVEFKKVEYNNVNPKNFVVNGNGVLNNINKIINQPHKIKDNYGIKIGIATLRDDLYMVKNTGNKFVKEFSGKTYDIEKGIVTKILLANNIQSKNDKKELYGWVIFPYELKENKYGIIPEENLKKRFPNCYSYLKAIKPELMKRDKGRERINNYGAWYAYGRVQGYNAIGNKLVCPNMMPEPRFEKIKDDSLFVAGYAIVGNGEIDLLSKILNSRIFWYYVEHQAKKIRSEFYVVNKRILGEFSLPELTESEKNFLLNESSLTKIDNFLAERYNIKI